jgi:hypothetical protein
MKMKLGIAALTLGLLSACSNNTPTPVTPEGGNQQVIASGISEEEPDWGILDPGYSSVVDKVANMTNDEQLQHAVNRRGLSLVNVMWEDTGRFEGSSVGPNITDLTLQVRYRQPGNEGETTALMPVIRFPNFTDRTGDIPANKFFLRVGNQRDKDHLTTVPLTDVLRNIKRFASQPWSIEGDGNLLSKRDTHFLVSSQAVFLPVPKQGKAEFNPVVFNYQSAPGSPAVLTILVTRQGTSMSVVENRQEDSTSQGWGQELYYNNEGKSAAFTAERLSDVKERIASQGGPKTQDDRSSLQKGADVIFLIQVPLKHRHVARHFEGAPMAAADAESAAPPAPPAKASRRAEAEESDVEQAVIGHGRNRGPFNEGHGLRLERDERFPIRVTVQFYKATSNGVVSESDLDNISRSIGNVYEHADAVGSLVLPEGDRNRVTAWQNVPSSWFPF